MRLIEAVLAVCMLTAAFITPQLGFPRFHAREDAFGKLSGRSGVLLVGIAALLIRAALLAIMPRPTPVIGDEFGYLLQADTFVHGRLTNPPHPMWQHFETFNVLQKPTYQCFMQPAQGLILAIGKIVFGDPFWGVWLSVGVMCSAICWMLQGWLSPGWAVLGGFLAVLRFGIYGYWVDGYMGGAVAATGGALVLGALPRIRQSQRAMDAILMGLGCALLAASRPYEGLVFCIPIGVALLVWMSGKDAPPRRVLFSRVVIPASVVISLGGAALAFYFYRVTGSPFVMPYSIHQETYAVAPYFIWQSLRNAPFYHQAAIRDAYANLYVSIYHFARSPIGMFMKLYWVWNFFLGPALTVPLLLSLATLPYGFSWKEISKETRFLLVLLLISLLSLMLETYYGAHYAAPITGLLLLLVLMSMQHLRNWEWRGKPTGLFVTRVIPLICVVTIVIRAFAGPLHIALPKSPEPAWFEARSEDFGRAAVIAELSRRPAKQLVMVRYGSKHPFIHEWVYNDADIDSSKIVWAHEMSTAENEELLHYFRGRQVWMLDADAKPPVLSPWMGEAPDK